MSESAVFSEVETDIRAYIADAEKLGLHGGVPWGTVKELLESIDKERAARSASHPARELSAWLRSEAKKISDFVEQHPKLCSPGDSETAEKMRQSALAIDQSATVIAALEKYLGAHDTLEGVRSADSATNESMASDGGFEAAANFAWRDMRAALYTHRKKPAPAAEPDRGPDEDFFDRDEGHNE